MKNNKGFTLIELVMVTIILGILAAVAIPRYMETVAKAEEAAEDVVISAIVDGLEMFATEKLIDNGRRSWPTNPFDALQTKPGGYNDADTDGVCGDIDNCPIAHNPGQEDTDGDSEGDVCDASPGCADNSTVDECGVCGGPGYLTFYMMLIVMDWVTLIQIF